MRVKMILVNLLIFQRGSLFTTESEWFRIVEDQSLCIKQGGW
jgi:hypothetical protein